MDAHKLEHLTKVTARAIVGRWSPGQHTLDAEERLFNVALSRIHRAKPEIIWEEAGGHRFVITVAADPILHLPEHTELMQQEDGSARVHALYPNEARFRVLSTLVEVEVPICHKRYRNVAPNPATGEAQWRLEYVELTTLRPAKIPSLVGGEFCRARRSGLMCDEDPDDPQVYYIHEGTEKFVECHKNAAPSTPLVFFMSNERVNLIECDYRPANENFLRTGAALHLYLGVPDAAAHRQKFERALKQRPSDRDYAIDVYHSENNDGALDDMFSFAPPPSSTTGEHHHSNVYETLSLALQNLAVNPNLTAMFVLLGCTDRAAMLRYVCPFAPSSQPRRTLVRKATRILAQAVSYAGDASRAPSAAALAQLREHLAAHEYLEHARHERIDGRTVDEWLVHFAHASNPKDAKKGVKQLLNSLQVEMLSDMGVGASVVTLEGKRRQLGGLVLKMLCVDSGLEPEDDIDHLGNKVVVGADSMFAFRYKTVWDEGINALTAAISKAHKDTRGAYSVRELLLPRSNNVKPIFDPLPFYGPMSTGAFMYSATEFNGVVQAKSAYSAAEAYEQLRRIRNKLHPHCKYRAPHELHDSHYGRECAVHTPADKNAGLLTFLCLGARVRSGYDLAWILPAVLGVARHGIVSLPDVLAANKSDEFYANAVVVKVNGRLIGYTRAPWTTLVEVRRSRLGHYAHLPYDLSVTWVGGPMYRGGPLRLPYGNYIHINGNAGVILRPLLCTAQLYKLEHLVACYAGLDKELHDVLVDEGVVEYVDIDEESEARVALSFGALLAEEPFWLCKNAAQRRAALHARHARLPHYLAPQQIRYRYAEHVAFTERVPLKARHSGAWTPPYTHLNITPEFSKGFLASTIPFPNHNNGTRDTFGSNMKSQATGPMPLNFRRRKNIPLYTQLIPKRTLAPTLVQAFVNGYGGLANHAEPELVAVMSHRYNNEDAVARIKPQFGQGHTIKTVHVFAATKLGATADNEKLAKAGLPFFGNPTAYACRDLKAASYAALDADGIPIVGRVVKRGEALVGRMVNSLQLLPAYEADARHAATVGAVDKYWMHDKSDVNTGAYALTVQRVAMTTSLTGSNVLHVWCKALIVPEVGGKYSTDHGQKGACSVFLDRWDMPTLVNPRRPEETLVPDELMGAHAIAGRTTVGQPLEALNALLAVCARGLVRTVSPNGLFLAHNAYDHMQGTVDRSASLRAEALAGEGRVPADGEFIALDPHTLEPLQVRISAGWNDCMTLEHFVTTKTNNRVYGSVDQKTRQPVSGLANEGGNRLGYMENAGLNQAGVTHALNEATGASSDMAEYAVCLVCGLYSVDNGDECRLCQRTQSVRRVQMSTSFHLMATESMGAGIAWRIGFDRDLVRRLESAHGDGSARSSGDTQEPQAVTSPWMPRAASPVPPPVSPQYAPPQPAFFADGRVLGPAGFVYPQI